MTLESKGRFMRPSGPISAVRDNSGAECTVDAADRGDHGVSGFLSHFVDDLLDVAVHSVMLQPIAPGQ